MKTAIYIEDSALQLVLTPETEWEKSALKYFHEKSMTAKFFNGEFSTCRGGYIRQFELGIGYGRDTAENASLMIRADIAPPFVPESLQPPDRSPGAP